MGHNRNLADYAHHFDGTHIDLGSGNIETQGVLTYEDVTNVDAIGIVTARAGVKVPDNQKIILGTGSDLQIYHDGSNSHVSDQGTGDLRLSGNVVKFNNQSNTATMVMATQGGSVVLNHDGSTKFETTATGATVTGTLVSDGVTSELDLSAISSSISDTAVDVFVYDTRKDSDGGAWRKRTQHTSWYNETLGTATRGSRKEFPAVAVIVTETSQVTIYDGDDPDLPMWMVFNAGSGNALWYNNGATATVMLNGKLANASGNNQRFRTIDFLSDSHLEYSHTDGRTTFGINISQRNSGAGSFNYGNVSGSGLINRYCNDVAMTVLPNAPIDDATGLPVPTIAVATDGGVSVIKDDGSVVDITASGYTATDNKIDFDYLNNLLYLESGGFPQRQSIPSSDIIRSAAGGRDRVYGGTSSYVPTMLGTSSNIVTNSDGFLSGSTSGLSILDYDSSQSQEMVAYVTTSYNTGYMHGDIKGAFLSDTDTTTVTGSELITNGTFDTNTTGWSAVGGATLSVSSNRLVVTGDGSTGGGGAAQSFTTVAGKKYVLTYVAYAGSINVGQVRVGTGANAYDITFDNSVNSNAYDPIYFTAAGTTTFITFGVNAGQATSGSFQYDNISVREVDEDRSVNNKGTAVYGTITKQLVATGADLVAYSNFSASNHLRQPPNSDMNIGTGDAYEMIWFKTTLTSGTMMMISYEGGATGTTSYGLPFNIRYENGSVRGWASPNGFTTYDDVNHGVSTADGQWHCAAWVKRGQVFELYVDGEFIGSDTGGVGSNALSDANSELVIGGRKRGNYVGTSEEPWNNGSLALARIGKSAPSAEQIKKIYEDEKLLFQENAKATLYGSSDAVTALGYDEDTELLHVGTSSGRSDFQGLRRINNTTTAVTTAISASDELIAEQ